MPMLFWLPLIFMSAVVELSTPIQVRPPIAAPNAGRRLIFKCTGTRTARPS
jgi:hypothetical protein